MHQSKSNRKTGGLRHIWDVKELLRALISRVAYSKFNMQRARHHKARDVWPNASPASTCKDVEPLDWQKIWALPTVDVLGVAVYCVSTCKWMNTWTRTHMHISLKISRSHKYTSTYGHCKWTGYQITYIEVYAWQCTSLQQGNTENT